MSDETEGTTQDPGEEPKAEEPKTEGAAPEGDKAPEGEKTPEEVIQQAVQDQKESAESHHTPGTVVLTFVFLLTFAVYYFANWKALADVWHVR